VDVTKAEQITGACAEHGEGPFWDAAGGRLLFVDLERGAVLALTEGGTVDRHEIGGVTAAIRARRGGGYVLATRRGFRLLSAALAPAGDEIVAFGDPAIRMNDGGCDPQGRFYCGSMAYDVTPGAGALFRLDPDLSVHRVLSGVTISNGIHWHRSGRLVYYADTMTGRVDVYDFDPGTGGFSGRRVFTTIDEGAGRPDGMAIDEDGGVWVALWQGGAIHRYDETGRLSERVEVPVHLTTACTFGGPDQATLFITTSRQGLGATAEAAAGAVFAIRPGVRGAELPAFAG
jgi:sugar lactone lactonase YvrE